MSVQDLRLVGTTDDGMHLLLAGESGERYRLPFDPALRSAVRHERPRPGAGPAEPTVTSPRQVQALIRAGASTDEVAEVSGWSAEKIARYEGPIIAEREHVASLATTVRLRGGGTGPSLLGARVAERLTERGVDPATASWDAWRVAGSPWTLALTFAAGGRLREAAWHFDLGTREVDPVDDEARWLTGDDEPAAPEPLVPLSAPRRVYDVESEGGVHSSAVEAHDEVLEPIITEPRARRPHEADEESDLVASVRERSKARRRSRPATRGRRGRSSQDALPGTEAAAAASPVAEIDAVVEAAAPEAVGGPVETVQDAPPLPQGGPVSDAALTPAAADDDAAPLAGTGVEVTAGAVADLDPADDAPGAAAQSPAVEVEPAPAREVPVVPAAHPRVSGQVEFPGMEDPRSEDGGPATEPIVAEPTAAQVTAADEAESAPDESAALADRTTGTASRASAPDDDPASEAPSSDQDTPQQPDRPQRRSTPRRKAGRPSVPSWDDIMFGARKDD